MRHKRISDRDLCVFLDKVQLTYLLERDKGWNSVQNWVDVLSGGEKQRIAVSIVLFSVLNCDENI